MWEYLQLIKCSTETQALSSKIFDYDNVGYIPAVQYQTNRTVNTVFGEIDEGLLRIAAPVSKFQNNPPKTVEEKRKEREKEKIDEEEPAIK